MSNPDTSIHPHYRPCPEAILAECRNQLDSLYDLNHLAFLDAVMDSTQELNIAMMDVRLHILADMLFVPA